MALHTDPQGFWLTHQQLGEMAKRSRHHVGRKLAAFAYGDEDA